MRFRRVAPIVLIAMLAAGCTSDAPSSTPTHSVVSTPPSTPPVSTSVVPVSPTPSVATTGPNVRPGEKPPVLPASGLQNTIAGAVFFAAYWMQSIDWAYATMDSELPRTLTSKACSDCARFLDGAIGEPKKKGQHFKGGRISILSTRVRPNDRNHDATAVVDVTVMQAQLQLVTMQNKVLENTSPVRRATFRTWLRWMGHDWTVVDWKQAV